MINAPVVIGLGIVGVYSNRSGEADRQAVVSWQHLVVHKENCSGLIVATRRLEIRGY
jgi:hypothetical protein